MKIELYIDTAEVAAAFAEFLPKYQDALARAQGRMVGEQAPIKSGWVPEPEGKAPAAEAPAEPEAKPAAPTISRRPAKKEKPAPVEVQEELVLPEPEPEVEAEPEAPADDAEPVTLEDLRRALRVFGSTKGADALTALYAKFGVQKLSDIPPESYAEVLAEVAA